MNFNECRKRLWVLTVLVVALLISATANVGVNPADVRTTTHFSPPLTFGVAADGRIFAGDPFIGCEVVEVRITWDVVVADGHDAADIFADVALPIHTNSGNSVIILDGATLGWSGSGTFNHYEATDRYNGFFGQAGTGFGHQSWGLPFDAVDILPTSRIEIDYVVPEPVKYGGGSGISEDPYQIWDANHMQAIGADANDWDKHFKLMADVDLGAYTGEQFNIIGTMREKFVGTFDGAGHTIANFTYTTANGNFVGLFSQVGDGAQIKDVRLDDVAIEVGQGSSVGALVGFNWRGIISRCYVSGSVVGGDNCANLGPLVGFNSWGTVSECQATGSVTGGSNASSLGGLVGNNAHGDIQDCRANATVSGGPASSDIGGLVGYSEAGTVTGGSATGNVGGDTSLGGLVGYKNDGGIIQCYATGTVSGNTRLGGLVGRNDSGSISDCYATGGIDGVDALGGLVGRNHKGSVSNCFAAGAVNGSSRLAGLVGNEDRGSYVSCFWDCDANLGLTGAGDVDPDPADIAGKTTTEMKTAKTFLEAGWDFINVWGTGENQTYPYLRKYSAADINQDAIVNLLDLCVVAEQWMEEQQ